MFSPLKFFKNAIPNNNHYNIARLAKSGCLAGIFTTNFDTAIEQALTEYGVKYSIYITESDFSRFDFNSGILPIFKLHGSLAVVEGKVDEFVVLMQDCGKPLTHFKANTLSRFLKEKDFMFLGYSGCDDFDIYPILYNTESTRKLLWVSHTSKQDYFYEIAGDSFGEQRPADHIEQLLKRKGSNAVRVVKHTGIYLNSFRSLALCEFGKNKELNAHNYAEDCWNIKIEDWSKQFWETEIPYLVKAIFQGRITGNSYIVINNLNKALEISIKRKNTEYQVLAQILAGIHLMEQEKYKSAMKLLNKAYRVSRENGLKRYLANAVNELGFLYMETNQHQHAIVTMIKALDEINAEELPEEYGLLLYSIGRVYWYKNNFEKTIEFWEESIDIRRKCGDVINLPVTLFNLAQIYAKTGYYQKALDYIIEGFTVELKTSPGNLVGHDKTVGLLYALLQQKDPFINRENIVKKLIENGLSEIVSF